MSLFRSPRRLLRSLLFPALVGGVTACGERSPLGTEPPPSDTTGTPAGPVSFPALGLGAVPERYTAELWVHGGYAYTTTWSRREGNQGNAVKIWDVRGDTPVLTDSILVSGATTLGDVQVTDDGSLLVVATEYVPGSMIVFDLADPARPRQVARFSSENTHPGVHTAWLSRVGGRLLAFLSVDPLGGLDPVPARLVIVDLSDPARPREVSTLTIGRPFVHDVFVRGGILFTALWNEGVALWDIGGGGRGGSPEDPVRMGTVQTIGGAAHNVWWYHDPRTGDRRYAFVGEEQPGITGSSSRGDVHVVDVSDWENPREVAFFSIPGAGTHNFWVDERKGILYAAYYNAGVRALDIRGDLGTCTAEQRSPDGRCDLWKMGREVGSGLVDAGRPVFVWGVQQVGPDLYASDMLNGLWKLSLAPLP